MFWDLEALIRALFGEPEEPTPDVTIALLRPDDLVSLDVLGFNLALDPNASPAEPRLSRIDRDRDAYLVFAFPPQSIVEAAYFPEAPNEPDLQKPGIPPIARRMAGLSRLAFRLPPAVESVPYTIDGLLDWSRWELSVAPVAAVTPDTPKNRLPEIARPTALQTALELPYRLVLSPGPNAPWRHARLPVMHDGRTELWHTRLARRLASPGGPDPDGSTPTIGEVSLANPAPLRAVWSPDYHPGNPPAHGLRDFGAVTALNANDRHQIVALTSGFAGYTVLGPALFILNQIGGDRPRPVRVRVGYVPKPIQADRVMLSSLGGWLRSRGAWEVDADNPPISDVGERDRLSVSEWVHDATLARDHYVKVVTEGSLCFPGHRAARVKETERAFQEIPEGRIKGTPGAYLRQRMYTVLREPEKQYAGAPFDHAGREQPFIRSIRITTLVTPDMDNPVTIQGTDDSHWIMVNDQPFRFQMEGSDLEGNRVSWTAALIFVPAHETQLQAVVEEYRKHPEWTACPVPGQKVTYASAGGSDNTTLVTNSVSFDAKAGTNIKGRFLPTLRKADVQIPAVEQIVGAKASTSIAYYDGYLKSGFDGQAGVFARIVKQVGAQLQEAELPVGFSADKAGGIATPSLGYTSLSRGLGPLAGKPADAALGTFRPDDFFPSDAATLFGTIPLKALIDGNAGMAANAPKIVTTTIPSPPAPPIELVTTLDWSPAVKSKTVGALEFIPRGSKLDIHAVLTKPVGVPGDGTFAMQGTLTSFTLKFADIIELAFKAFSFSAASGQKSAITVDIELADGIKFAGDLEFVEQLRNAIPPGIFGDGPSLDITPTELRAGFAVALPPITVAVFSLQQVSLYAGLVLPFQDGKPVFEFKFAERHRPFLLTIAIFGGGGFFGLQVGADGLKQMEASLEFGGAFALDIGVASGGVFIMAGIYFAMKIDDVGQTQITLSGYLRCGGEVTVLGLVSISVEFMLSFTYMSAPVDKVQGRATLVVSVKVAIFSVSVELTVERSFGGHGGDPTFGQLHDAGAWHEYASAFA
jgi:hypothetical protein